MTELMRWNPAREMLTLRNEMDRLFDDFFGAPTVRQQNPISWGIPVDVRETEDGYKIEAMVPGMKPEDIDISITDNVLTISAQTNTDQQQDQEHYHIRERRFGSFSRTLTMPQGINPEAVQADYENGVLKIAVPKSPEARPRRITVNQRDQGKQVIDAQATSASQENSRSQRSDGQGANKQDSAQSASHGINQAQEKQGNSR